MKEMRRLDKAAAKEQRRRDEAKKGKPWRNEANKEKPPRDAASENNARAYRESLRVMPRYFKRQSTTGKSVGWMKRRIQRLDVALS